MENPYIIIIIFSGLIIFSYIFTQIAKYTKVPAVIFLIGTGVTIQFIAKSTGFHIPNLGGPLRLLGIVGLMMIVLEGALDFEVHRKKLRMIFAACASSIIILGITNVLIGLAFVYLNDVEFGKAFLSAIPLSVVSSAIVIPSVHNLIPAKKEFMVLESTLSDIFGIMLFEFWVYDPHNDVSYPDPATMDIFISIAFSIVASFILVYVFHKIRTEIKFFLFLSILALLFAIGEYFHYSALLIILVFGMVLNNTHIFFRGPLNKLIDEDKIKSIREEFVLITLETSFLIRTFFFVAFGMSMNLEGLFETSTLLTAGVVMLIIFLTRALNLLVFVRSGSIFPQMLIAPRGLVTILLFNKLVEHHQIMPFSEGVLALVIIGTNLTMMVAMILSGNKEEDLHRKSVKAVKVFHGPHKAPEIIDRSDANHSKEDESI